MRRLLLLQLAVLAVGLVLACFAWRTNDRELWLAATAFSVAGVVSGAVLFIAAIVERRVLFAAGGLLLGGAAFIAAWMQLLVGAATADPAGRPVRRGRRRLSRAQQEYESVPAFARVAFQLWAHGAPAELIARAHRAAIEEVEHARAFGGAVDAVPLPPLNAGTLRELAIESLVDGVYGEGRAAEQLAAEALREPDRVKRRVLEQIASEERGHAELARDIVTWVRSRASSPAAR